jgi:chemotaxis protein histidine kinase CheA
MSFGGNEGMMDLFRSEVESHSEQLSNSLLQLERDPSDTSVYDSMMRSAHSIKGAARIVRVDAAVEVSHVMEDCFVAAQRGELQIKPSDFDLLLRGVDLLGRISEATKDAEPQLDDLSDDVDDCVAQLKCLREGQPHSPAAPLVRTPAPAAEKLALPLRQLAGEASSPEKGLPRETADTSATKHRIVLECGPALYQERAEEMRKVLLHDLKNDVEEVRFDLSKTLDIDPIGLAFLSAARSHVEQHSTARVHFLPVSAEMQLVLRVAGIGQS